MVNREIWIFLSFLASGMSFLFAQLTAVWVKYDGDWKFNFGSGIGVRVLPYVSEYGLFNFCFLLPRVECYSLNMLRFEDSLRHEIIRFYGAIPDVFLIQQAKICFYICYGLLSISAVFYVIWTYTRQRRDEVGTAFSLMLCGISQIVGLASFMRSYGHIESVTVQYPLAAAWVSVVLQIFTAAVTFCGKDGLVRNLKEDALSYRVMFRIAKPPITTVQAP